MTTLDVAAIQAMQFPEPRCWSLTSYVYLDVLGKDPARMRTVTEAVREAARTFSLRLVKGSPGLQQVPEPVEFAIALMWPTVKRKDPHCGVVYEGKVLHATKEATLHQDIASLRSSFAVLEFWAYV